MRRRRSPLSGRKFPPPSIELKKVANNTSRKERKGVFWLLLRGIQKQVIVVQDTGSEFFDQAIFIVSAKGQGRRRGDMVAAARGIVDARLRSGRVKRPETGRRRLILAAALGSAVTLLLGLLLSYFLL